MPKKENRGEDEEKTQSRGETKEKTEMTEEERMRTIEDKVKVRLCGLDNSPAGCDAITTGPNLRRSRGGQDRGGGQTMTEY